MGEIQEYVNLYIKCVDKLHPPICSNKRTSVVMRRRTTKDLLNDSVEYSLGDEKSVKKQRYKLSFLIHVVKTEYFHDVIGISDISRLHWIIGLKT